MAFGNLRLPLLQVVLRLDLLVVELREVLLVEVDLIVVPIFL